MSHHPSIHLEDRRTGATRMSYFNQLEQQIDWQFGRDNVRVLHRELTAPF